MHIDYLQTEIGIASWDVSDCFYSLGYQRAGDFTMHRSAIGDLLEILQHIKKMNEQHHVITRRKGMVYVVQ